MIRQQIELMATEGVELVFSEAAIDEIASVTADVNQNTEDSMFISPVEFSSLLNMIRYMSSNYCLV